MVFCLGNTDNKPAGFSAEHRIKGLRNYLKTVKNGWETIKGVAKDFWKLAHFLNNFSNRRIKKCKEIDTVKNNMEL